MADTIPWATVAATLREMKAPTKFRIAAKPTASRGDMARVEMEVATTFAVSWKPLVKSNASAVRTTMTRMRSFSIARGQEFLMTIPSRMFATRSVASIAASRRSKMSFQRITNIGSMPASKSDAIASRLTRSPSFSSRLISTV